MLDEKAIQRVIERIVAAAQPSRVIVFGSYGRGDADEASDLDIVVVKPEVKNPYDELVRLYQSVGHVETGIDLLLYSEEEYLRRSAVPGTVLYWARKEGRALYEAAS